MMRGTVLHGFYEIAERDMKKLVRKHGVVTTPEVVMLLRDHFIQTGLKEILPDLVKDGSEKLMSQMFIIDLAAEVAHMYVTTYFHTLYHNPSRKTGGDILVREVRKSTEHRGHTISGKPDWFQYSDKGEGFIIDYKTGHPKKPDMYQHIQAGGYAWMLEKATGVKVYMHVVFWQGYHKFACIKPNPEMFEERLDEFIDTIAEADHPPPYLRVPSCNWCSPSIEAMCKMRREKK